MVRGKVVAWVLVVLFVAATVAWAAARPRVHKVNLDIYEQTDDEIVFYATWDIRHGTPDKVVCELIVDGEVVHLYSRPGWLALIVPYKFYTEAPIASGTKVTFAAWAVNDGREQRPKQDSVVVP